ncbi:hypothetical protein BT93_H1118 [Corymbia citriodora subsp. variegata]|nr:hypothetical protein BT93_H1118 [Corymbia citriodora subsp. variegata]
MEAGRNEKMIRASSSCKLSEVKYARSSANRKLQKTLVQCFPKKRSGKPFQGIDFSGIVLMFSHGIGRDLENNANETDCVGSAVSEPLKFLIWLQLHHLFFLILYK